MVIEQIFRQFEFSSVAFEAFHYRSSAGMEVDLILEGSFGRIAVEVKKGSVIKGRAISNLAKFIDEYSFDYGIIISNSLHCNMFHDRIIGIPARMI